ncbi:DUF4433 domain-containing protein [Massilia sp. 9096]|uniref:type II toxin-antitoxin system toxin DNA ADP-ribosyl transferase DarT n=1 Tax=Massilia sp. 9096 TaxID=1500894 RepID=UPI0009DFC76B|nr:DUF4433 domain-containing protein [Massilia sp. 9096]
MTTDPAKTRIYHITDVANLQSIIDEGALLSDAAMRASGKDVTEIGYATIKWRRLNTYRVDCCEGRFVGEFVPFYFCPRSPMLFTINKGNTGRPPGCQTTILHLVSNVNRAWSLQQPWAISDGNAGAAYTTFSNATDALEHVAWEVVRSDAWSGDRMNKKATEFLIEKSFPVDSLLGIGVHNEKIAAQVNKILVKNNIDLRVIVKKDWYFP